MSWHSLLQVLLATWCLLLPTPWGYQAIQPVNEAEHDLQAASGVHQVHELDEEEPRFVAGTFGMSPPMYAFVLGTGSGVSLIIGALVGIQLAPVSDLPCSAMMSFGAGALLFAVTIELYAHSLHELRHGHLAFWSEMCVILLFALIGAIFYLYVNRHLEEYLLGEDEWETHQAVVHQSPEAGIHSASASSFAPTPRANEPVKKLNPFKKAAESTPLVDKQPNPAIAPPNETPEEKKIRLKARAKQLWKKAKTLTRFSTFVTVQARQRVRGREKGMRQLMMEIKRMATSGIGLGTPRASRILGRSDTEVEAAVEERDETVQRAKLVALQLFLGLLVDGVPEAVLMGFLAARGHLTPVFIISLFFANFPEAFSSASLLTVAKMPSWGIVGMWTFLCLLVGGVAGISCACLLAMYPGYATGAVLPTPVLMGIAAIEGLTGGSMIACIAAVMLPEAFERMGKEPPLLLSSGFMCATGFLTAVLLKATTD